MSRALAIVSLLVREYDEAIAFFTNLFPERQAFPHQPRHSLSKGIIQSFNMIRLPCL